MSLKNFERYIDNAQAALEDYISDLQLEQDQNEEERQAEEEDTEIEVVNHQEEIDRLHGLLDDLRDLKLQVMP